MEDLTSKLAQRPDAGDIGTFTNDVASKTGVAQEPIQVLAGDIINVVFSVVGTAFLVLMVYGGLLWMTARGNQDQIKKAKTTVFSAAIGMVVVLASYAITNFVTGQLF